MSHDNRLRDSAISYIPATAVISTGIATKIISHDSSFALGMAALAGGLTLLAVFSVSRQAQKTLRKWIDRRSEHILAVAVGRNTKRKTRPATGGRRWSARSAAAVRASAAPYVEPDSDLAKFVRIARQADRTKKDQRPGRQGPRSAASGNGKTPGTLTILPPPPELPESPQ